jgi:GNAT superfamily N-acetyltransferase
MTEADLDAGLLLSRASGWNQSLSDWRLLLSLGPGLFRVACLGSRIVASGGAVRYGDALAWICMILVHPDERGQGLGTRVFDEVLARCRAEAGEGRLRSIGLDATPAGRGIYERRGFSEGPALLRMRVEHEPGSLSSREPGPPPSPSLAAMRPADLDALLTRDRDVFGADREAVLRHALDDAPELAFVARGETGVTGYCFGRRGDHSDHVGPVVADDPATALALVRASTAMPLRRPLTLDARVEPGFVDALASIGFRPVRPLTRMYLDGARPLSRPEREPVVFGPEFG